jgi:lincosamide nucleotidyltransferase A/C/D/E
MMMQTDRASRGMDLGEVLGVLGDLANAGCAVWVGGWGVDALVGRQTRLHRDLDLALVHSHRVRGALLAGSAGRSVQPTNL